MSKKMNEEQAVLANDQFLMGRKEAAERYGHLSRNAASWRRMATALLVCCVACVAAVIHYSTRFTVIPYIVQVDSHGYEIAVEPVKASPIDVRMVISRISRYIHAMKTVYADSVAQTELMRFVYNSTSVTSMAETRYKEYYVANNPLIIGKKSKVIVTVNSVLSLAENKWQAEWKEEKITEGNVETKHYRGIFDTVINSPSSMQEVLDNPLGIFVVDFTFTEITG
jgi:type IV secretion system protein VirB5